MNIHITRGVLIAAFLILTLFTALNLVYFAPSAFFEVTQILLAAIAILLFAFHAYGGQSSGIWRPNLWLLGFLLLGPLAMLIYLLLLENRSSE